MPPAVLQTTSATRPSVLTLEIGFCFKPANSRRSLAGNGRLDNHQNRNALALRVARLVDGCPILPLRVPNIRTLAPKGPICNRGMARHRERFWLPTRSGKF